MQAKMSTNVTCVMLLLLLALSATALPIRVGLAKNRNQVKQLDDQQNGKEQDGKCTECKVWA